VQPDTRESLYELAEMTAGPALWFVHLLAVYGATALACADLLPFASGGVAIAVGAGAVSLLALTASIWLLVRALRERAAPAAGEARHFVNRVTAALCVFSVIAIVWTTVPVVLTPACEPAGVQAARDAQRSP
jgi:hypothetical protein